MTLEQAKKLLADNNIQYNLIEFENEAEYWFHTMKYPYTKNARPCKVTALSIPSVNSKMNIELQFNEDGGVFRFEDMLFGAFSYEMGDIKEEFLTDEILSLINDIKSGSVAVIAANDLKRKKWLFDGSYDLNDDSFMFEKTVERIDKPKSVFERLIKSKKQYEIYDWNTYRLVVK